MKNIKNVYRAYSFSNYFICFNVCYSSSLTQLKQVQVFQSSTNKNVYHAPSNTSKLMLTESNSEAWTSRFLKIVSKENLATKKSFFRVSRWCVKVPQKSSAIRWIQKNNFVKLFDLYNCATLPQNCGARFLEFGRALHIIAARAS